ncbi:hypothetical protein LOTGIDRAFT_230489 [Lottia gigantea]|uniref:VWFC domain-containing protein n=1 Tax=Lottia gigantea TaxID=225164 RepID=V4BAS3_LOTGI|nr:hypothetical protein LOTGIDRAFT_230489 [Lottia gigantea]ESP03057.1 hypothetical protein LOTGIDRAFT_230489 [Lottia gigantea]
MFSLVLLAVTPWLAFCMPPPTTTPSAPTTPPLPTTTSFVPTTMTTPAICICSDGTQVPPGETVWITACHGCTCDEYSLEAQEIIADCFITPCVDSIDISGQCCPHCPNGENCRAEFIDFNGTARSEVISVSDGVVDFGVVQCQCDHQNYYGEPRASCVQISTTPPPPTTTPSTTSPPTTTPAMCTCSDGTQVPPGGTHSISDCHSCYCDENSLQAQEMIADCFIVPCVDSVKIPGQCCANCPNGENCRAEFTDFNGKKRSEVISVSDGVVDFGAVQCQCEHQNYYGEPRASCVQITTPPPTTTPAMCTCSDGTKIPPGETVWITDCRGCYCDEYNLEAYEMIMDCFWTPCVDSLNVPGQCCPHCPNGENCRAEFIDDNGVERSEIIKVSDGVVKFNSTECQCDYQNYNGEPKANCVQVLSIEPVAAKLTTP